MSESSNEELLQSRPDADLESNRKGDLSGDHLASGLERQSVFERVVGIPALPPGGLNISINATIYSLHYRAIAKEIGTMATSVALSYFLEMLVPFLSLFFLGNNFSTTVLAGGALGMMFINVSGLSVGFGMATALDTLLSQAFGANRQSLAAVYLQRGTLILGTLAVPVAMVWASTEWIMLGFRQDPEVARVAGTFTRILILGLPAIYSIEITKKFLYAQRVVAPQTAIIIAGVPFHCGLLWLLVRVLRWDYRAVAFSIAITWNLMAISLACYVLYSGLLSAIWTGWSREALSGWREFFALGLPGMLMMICEWVAFEVLTLIAGMMGPTEQATQAVAMNIASIIYMVPLGIAIAATAQVGNMFGAGSKAGAMRTALCTYGIVICTGTVFASFLIATHNILPRLYTSDPVVVHEVGKALKVIACMHIFDSLQSAGQGILKGGGRQIIGATVNFSAYFLLGVPLGALLAFKIGLGVQGLWMGMMLGTLISSSTFVAIIRLQDWDKLIERARQRVGAIVDGDDDGSGDDGLVMGKLIAVGEVVDARDGGGSLGSDGSDGRQDRPDAE